MTQGVIFDIKRYAIHDGPGIRVTVFLKGCPLKCLWCHNPEGQNPDPETMIPQTHSEAPPQISRNQKAGTLLTVNEVMDEIEKDVLFFDESGGGVTFSGGEPLMQPEFLTSLLQVSKERGIHTAVDTCGDAPSDVFNSIIEKVDLFLFDLKLMNDTQHQKYTGVSNRQILENVTLLDTKAKRVIIRFPVVPAITDTEENISDIAALLVSLNRIRDVTLLPYHRIAAQKYKRLQRQYTTAGVQPPPSERIESIRTRFESQGIRVSIGG